MELAYRLAVDEGEYVEGDSRERDHAHHAGHRGGWTRPDGRRLQAVAGAQARPGGVPLIYWGKYTAHDNNRDGMVLSQKLYAELHARISALAADVVHDLHESVPFLYT